jgi:hypothetical protein
VNPLDDGPVSLRSDRREDRLRIGASLALIALGVIFIRNEWPGGYLLVVAFTLTLLVGLLQLTTNCSGVTIDSQGFEVASLFRKRRYAWNEIREFHIERFGPLECVVFSFRNEPVDADSSLDLASEFAPLAYHLSQRAIPQNCGLPVGELAQMLKGRLASAQLSRPQ